MVESGICQQWQTTDRSMLITHIVLMAEFIDKLNASIHTLTAYSYIAKYKARHLTITQRSDEISCIIPFDFAENYQCIIQNASQEF